ncbi:MAG: hypothetical protein ACI9NT_000083, partial [Bacteroidia bacterium]
VLIKTSPTTDCDGEFARVSAVDLRIEAMRHGLTL